MADLLEKVISLAKRRGFVFPGSEIYGGLANTYDYGPLGVLLKKNLSDVWWKTFVTDRSDMYGLDTSNLMSPKVWEASGHTTGFSDVVIDCKNCQLRTRADHLIEDFLQESYQTLKVEGLETEEMEKIIKDNKIPCPKCKEINWTKPRKFNLLFETEIGIISGEKSQAYLRGELAQGMFVNFKNVVDSMHPKLPFGIAQLGKAYRNEITMGKFTFRTLEFDLAEFEYFVRPENWEASFENWKKKMYEFALALGLNEANIRWRPHTKEELSHYSQRTEDLEFKFPWGYKEMWGLAYRTDFDLKNHMEKSGVNMQYVDPLTNEKFIPHVVEPTFGISRLFTILLMNAYTEEDHRVYLKFKPSLAPYKAAVFPLLKNKPELVEKARSVYESLKPHFAVTWDDRGNIGKRYYSQDEIGTPFCITVDFESLDDDAVTVRDRDTAKQERIMLKELHSYLTEKLAA